MSATSSATATTAHPSPHRAKVSLAALLFGLVGGPAAWFGQFVANYALASFACFPHDTPRVGTGPLWPSVPTAMLAINIAGMAIALLAAFVAWRLWSVTHGEQPGPTSHLLEVGEGRTRFLAVVGLMAGLGFFGAIAFNVVALLMVPTCAG